MVIEEIPHTKYSLNGIINFYPITLDKLYNLTLCRQESVNVITNNKIVTAFFDSKVLFDLGYLTGVIINNRIYGIKGKLREVNKLVTSSIAMMKDNPDTNIYEYIQMEIKL